jgi:hypothetical protein
MFWYPAPNHRRTFFPKSVAVLSAEKRKKWLPTYADDSHCASVTFGFYAGRPSAGLAPGCLPVLSGRRLALALVIGVWIAGGTVHAQQPAARNVVLITLDGLRWQEVFGGVDSLLVHDTMFAPRGSKLPDEFWRGAREARRRLLLPFLWDSIAARGQLYGDRTANSLADITNPQRFSYPGYSELLVGHADSAIKSNAKVLNPNRTVLEFLNEQPSLRGKVAAFASWDVFPYIINEERSGISVNAGAEPANGASLTERERLLNSMLTQLPNPWPGVRHDALTFNYALEYLKRARPRVVYIALDETDDFAHEKKYHEYIRAARRADEMIRELWSWLQMTDGYRNNTTLIVTTDHGRGNGAAWPDHWTAVAGAQHIWLAVLGPDTPARGVVSGQIYQNQVAATLALLLGQRYAPDARTGSAISGVVR